MILSIEKVIKNVQVISSFANVVCLKCLFSDFLIVRMLPSLKFVSHKLVLIDMKVTQTIGLAFCVGVHSGWSTTLENSASQGIIGSNGWWISLRGLVDHTGSTDK